MVFIVCLIRLVKTSDLHLYEHKIRQNCLSLIFAQFERTSMFRFLVDFTHFILLQSQRSLGVLYFEGQNFPAIKGSRL